MLDRMHVESTGEKELKVKIAARLHMQLHSRKILQGQRIQDTVTEALEAYFERIRADAAAKMDDDARDAALLAAENHARQRA